MANSMDTFRQALRSLIEAYSPELFQDMRRTNALLMDYAPSQVKERRLIITALEEGVGKDLIRVMQQPEQDQQLCINRCIRRMVSDAWVTEEAARFAVSAIAFSLDLSGDTAPEPEPAPREKTVPTSLTYLHKGVLSPDLTDVQGSLAPYQCIGYKAFACNVSLTHLELPQGARIIGPKAFQDCVQLKSIRLPASIEAIGLGAFSGCDSLETITLERNPHYTVAGGMLIDKKNKALMRSTRSVPERCAIPREITTIHAYAFQRSPVTEVTLPRNLTTLDPLAFSGCGQLRRFDIDRQNEHFVCKDGVLHSRDRTQLLRFPTGSRDINYIIEETVTHIAGGAFSGSAHLESVTLTSNLKTIGPRAFEYCEKLSSLVLPSSVQSIGERAFQYCGQLFSIMLPRSIQEIGDFAFSGCGRIQTLSIPKAVTRIGHCAFSGCGALKKVIVQDNISFIGDGAFSGCDPELVVAIRNNPYVQRYCTAHKIQWTTI